MAERECDARIERDIACHETLRVPPEGSRCHPRYGGGLQLATQRVVQRIAQARRTIVAVVVVAIKLVLWQRIPLNELLQRQSLRRRKIQLLRENRAIAP